MTILRTECLGLRLDGHPRHAKSRSDRGQFVDVIDENAFRAKGASESVEWSSGRPVVIFNFSIKAQVGRLMVAICFSGCVSTVDLTSVAVVWNISRQYANSSSFSEDPGRRRIPFGAVGRLDFGTNIKIGRWYYVDAAPALSLHLRLRDDGTQEETGLTTWRWAHRGHVLRRITYNPISVSLFLFPSSSVSLRSPPPLPLFAPLSSFSSSSKFLSSPALSRSLSFSPSLFRALGLADCSSLLRSPRRRRSACRPSFRRALFIVARRCLLSVWEHATFRHYRL